MSSIFIQIASYRDPELVSTLSSLIDKKSCENALHICIHNQYSETDVFDKDLDNFILDQHKNKLVDFTVIRTHYSESKGACWARNAIQQEYKEEDYTLQLDSHHRFVENWDLECIKMVKQLQKRGYSKPLLTGYIPSYDPENDPEGRTQQAWRMTFDRFIPEGAVFFLPEEIQGWQDLTEPIPARFYSAHFCFTLGKFSKEVQHDPQYYFHGEEISIAARAYTHGYDLFHTQKIIAWHEYTRKGRTKHWDDVPTWGEHNSQSHSRNRRLFSMDGEVYDKKEFGKYGFGKKRSLREYEKYSGLLFSKRAIQQSVIDKLDPPVTEVYETEQEWLDSFSQIFKHCIDVNYESVPEEDYEFWVVAFEDKEGNTIYRKDSTKEEIEGMMNDPDGYCKVWREFPTTVTPVKWVVWPYSESKTWCNKIEGNL